MSRFPWLFRVLLGFLVTSFSLPSFAGSVWTLASGPVISSPSSYCSTAFVPKTGWQTNGIVITGSSAVCSMINPKGDYGLVAGATGSYGEHMYRSGSCSEGTTYNGATGLCDAPVNKCSGKKGTGDKSFHWLSNTDEPSQLMSVGGCGASLTGATICKTASPSVYSCTGTITYTGDELAASNGSGTECTGAQCTEGEPKDTAKSEPCIKQDTGAGFTCTSTVEDSKTGSTNCGTANGVFVCVPETQPYKITKSTQVTQVQTPNADGSLTTKNVATTTTTTCVAGKCTTSKSTQTTSGGTSSSGMPTPQSTSCEGADCASAVGSGTVGGAGDSKNGKAEASADCKKPPACDGDVYQCALLNQDYINLCSLQIMPTAADEAKLQADIAKVKAGLATLQTELDQKGSAVLSAFKSAASSGGTGGGAKCLPDYNYSLMGHSIEMKFSAACEYLASLRYAILCIAYLLAIRRISQEL